MTYSYTEEPMKGEVGQQILHKVEEYTGTELDIDWVSSTNYSQKLSTVLTYSKDMPMIIATDGKSASVLYAARAGLFWDLDGSSPGISESVKIRSRDRQQHHD